MERLRKSFRRKKQKEIAEDDVEEEIEKDEFEKKSVLNAEEPGDTEEEADAESVHRFWVVVGSFLLIIKFVARFYSTSLRAAVGFLFTILF